MIKINSPCKKDTAIMHVHAVSSAGSSHKQAQAFKIYLVLFLRARALLVDSVARLYTGCSNYCHGGIGLKYAGPNERSNRYCQCSNMLTSDRVLAEHNACHILRGTESYLLDLLLSGEQTSFNEEEMKTRIPHSPDASLL